MKKDAQHISVLFTGTKQLAGNRNNLRPGHHYQKFKFHQQQATLVTHFDFTSFFSMAFFRLLATTFFTPGCFGWDY